MKDYSEKSTCPKCGNDWVSTKHGHAGWSSRLGEDHLVRRCARCGYEWHERPLDALTGTEKATE